MMQTKLSLVYRHSKITHRHFLMESDEVWNCDLCKKCFQYKSEIRNHLKLYNVLGRRCGFISNDTIMTTEEPHESGSSNVSKHKQYKERESPKLNKLGIKFRSDVRNSKNLEKLYCNADFEYVLKATLGEYEPRQSRYFKCKKCNVQFITKIGLDKHILSSHEDIKTDKNLDIIIYKCKICPYKSIYTYALYKHKSIWHKERVWHVCNICEYKTVKKVRLTRHMISTHEGVRFNCEFCNYQGPSVAALKHHNKVTHEGIRFPCSQCEFKAKNSPTLKIHIESKHSDIKYRCDKCGYEGPSSRSLANHKRENHKGNKHICDQCDLQFIRRSSLTVHLGIKHEGKRYSCQKCEYKSTTQRGLRLHRDKHADL